MAKVRTAEGGKRSAVLAVLVTLAAPVAAYAAVRNAVNDAAGNAAAPSALPPQSVVPDVKTVMRSARLTEGRLPPGSVELARRAAVKLPLAYEPYFIVARGEEQAGRYERATLLMEEARRRRPNAATVRVFLLGYYSLANAYQKAIDEADMAMRVNSRSATLILPAFAKLVAADARARAAVAVALAKRPPWRGGFLEAAANAKMDPESAAALVADVRRIAPSSTPQDEEAFLVRTLVAAGRYKQARALVASYGTADAAAIVDGKFAGVPAIAPFSWTLQAGQDGTAEISKASAGERSLLEVDYFGDTEVILASQTLALAPGRYRLTSTVRGETSAVDVGLIWGMFCLPSVRTIATLSLLPLGEGLARRETVVTIPVGGCEGQAISLLGKPGDVSRTLSAEITEVALVPLG